MLTNLGDREGPSLSRFLHTVSSAVLLRWRLSDGLVTSSLPARSRHNIDRFLLTCVWHQHTQDGESCVAFHSVPGAPCKSVPEQNTCACGSTSCPPLGSTTVIGKFRRSIGCSRTHCYLLRARLRGAYPSLTPWLCEVPPSFSLSLSVGLRLGL